MKLSVRWLAALAVLALAIIAVVGATSVTKADEGVTLTAAAEQLGFAEAAPAGQVAAQTLATDVDVGAAAIAGQNDMVVGTQQVVTTRTDSGVSTGTLTAAIGVVLVSLIVLTTRRRIRQAIKPITRPLFSSTLSLFGRSPGVRQVLTPLVATGLHKKFTGPSLAHPAPA